MSPNNLVKEDVKENSVTLSFILLMVRAGQQLVLKRVRDERGV